ncbi:MAG: extracellular solute-binding protein [Chloroflexi bacterium]|nr:extracellular solute-binding protein [Chloroflexota bacterium]
MGTSSKRLSRRGFLELSALLGVTAVAACAPAPPPTATPAPKPAAPAPPPTAAPKPAAAAPTPAAAPPTPTAAPKPAVAAPTPTAVPKPAAKEAVTVRVTYRLTDKPEMYERLFPRFAQENPSIKLVGEPVSFGAYEEYFAKLASLMAADTLGDVVWVSAGSGPFLSQVAKGFFRPLEDLVSAANYDLKVWYPSALEALKLGGKLYALPSDMHPGAQFIYYNKKMFDAASVKYPTSAWTYEDFVAVAGKLTKRSGDRVDVFGWAPWTTSWSQEIIARSHGGSFITADGKKSAVKEAPVGTTLEWLYDLMHKHKVATRKQDIAKDANEMFYTEQAGMTTALSGFIFSAPARIGDKFKMGTVRLPKGKAGKFGGMVHIGGQAIYAKTKNPNEAFKALAFIVGLENALIRALEVGGTLARRDLFEHAQLAEKGGDNWKVVLEAMADPDLKPYFTPDNFRTSEMQSVIDQNTDAFWTGNQTVAKGLDALDSALNVVLAKPR